MKLGQLLVASSRSAALFVTLAWLAAGCQKNTSSAPMVAKLDTQPVSAAPIAAQKLAAEKETQARKAGLVAAETADFVTPSDSPAVVSKVTLNKDSVLKKTFLYGTDLQYSSIGEVSLSLIRQSETTGLQIAFFRVVDDQLQLLADQRAQFESDVNHPERLLHVFPILAQDEKTITVQISRASPVLNTVIAGEKAQPVRTSWVRSVEYIAESQILMFETSIELADGKIAEFAESLYPRETVVPADAKPIFNDEELEPLAKRYRFLDMGDVFIDKDGKRIKTKIASRFASTPGTTIDWYVTPNIPDEYIPAVKAGLEGWNRYSQKMWGKDIVAFKGRLPAGVKLGDPRYNIVNWDSVAQAGAAYESQATDPLTGLTSHSLIYLPKAWINIGKKYWDEGGPSEADQARIARLRESIAGGSMLGRKLPVHCLADAMDKISTEGRLNSEEFAKELLKGVIFHEVGHALGLAHNFKGSLSFNPADPKSAFTTSIMDYNQYHLEKAAFDGLDSASGPLLEYDRQILSVLYNGGKDVASTDPVLPTCEDSETDSLDDGVDPLCIRYDAGHDPTEQLGLTIALIKSEDAMDRKQRSLSVSLKSLSAELGDASAVKTKEEAQAAVLKIVKAANGLVNFYYFNGAQALTYMTRANIRELRKFKAESLPAEYNEKELRARAIEGVRYATSAETLAPVVKTALENLTALVKAWLLTTNYVTALAQDKQADELKSLTGKLAALPAALEKVTLMKMRAKIFADMTASEKSPFFFLENGPQTIDFEREVAQILARAVTDKLADGSARIVDERLIAAKSLKTFAGTAVGSQFVSDAIDGVKAEVRGARDLETRSNAVAVLKLLTAPAEKEKDK